MITRRRVFRAALVLAVGLLAANIVRTRLNRAVTPPPPPAIHTTVSLPPNRTLDSFAVSPDGHVLAYAAELPDGHLHLFLRRTESTGTNGTGEREVAGALDAHDPFFSWDGESLGYFSRDAIWTARLEEGPSNRVCEAPADSAGATWTEDGRIVFAPLGGEGLSAVQASGGSPERVTTLNSREGELAHGWPHALRGGAVVFTVSQRGRDPHLEVLSASRERGPRLIPAIGQAAFVSSGFLVYSYLGDLYAVPFDSATLKTTGVPVPFARGVETSSGFDQLGRSGFSLSRTGTLAWFRASAGDGDSELVFVNEPGIATPTAAPPSAYQTPRISPDGRSLAVAVRSGFMSRDIRVLDIAHLDRAGVLIRGGDNQSPAWMPDGRLSFASNRDGLHRIYATARPVLIQIGSSTSPSIEPLFSMDVQSPRNPGSWIRRPPLLAFYEIDPVRHRDVMIYRVGEAIFPVSATAANERSPVLSPDGRSIAWVSDVSGRDEVYVRKLEGESAAQQISSGGGIEPVWSSKGLVYRQGDRLIRDGRTVLEGRFRKDPGANAAAYDVEPRGRFFVMLKAAPNAKEIRIVKNWRP